MEIERKTACTPTKSSGDGIVPIGEGENVPTTADLQVQRENLKAELHEAMVTGNASEVIQLRRQLEDIAPVFTAVAIRETKESIDQINERYSEVKLEKEELIRRRLVPASKAKKLMDQLDEVGKELHRFEIALGVNANEAEGLLETRRALRLKLASLIKAVEADVEASAKENRYETIGTI